MFLISEIGKATKESTGRPANLRELDRKIKSTRHTKKGLFGQITLKMNNVFGTDFDYKSVQRKWTTLTTNYRKKKDSMLTTGAAYVKFSFFEEMESLMGDHHDITPTVTAGPSGVVFAPQPVKQEVQQPVRQRAQQPAPEQAIAAEVAVVPADIVAVEVAAEPVPERNAAPRRRRRVEAVVDRDDRDIDRAELAFMEQTTREITATRQAIERLVDHIIARDNARNNQ